MDLNRLEDLRAAAQSWLAETATTAALDPARRPLLDIPAAMPTCALQAAVAPDCAYRLARAALRAARREICLYIYNISADYMFDLLRAALKRGVRIRLMYDVMDTRGDERQKIAALGAECQEAPSTGDRRVFTVCHQKFAVIDERILLLASANWANTSIPLVTQPGVFCKANREWLIRIDHAPLARWFKDLFDADWGIPAVEARWAESPSPAPP